MKIPGTSLGDKVLIGLPCVLVGLAMNYALFSIMPNPVNSVWDLLTFLVLSAYDVVANLFLLVGLKKIFGERPVFNRLIGDSLRRLIWTGLAVSFILVVVAAGVAMIR